MSRTSRSTRRQASPRRGWQYLAVLALLLVAVLWQRSGMPKMVTTVPTPERTSTPATAPVRPSARPSATRITGPTALVVVSVTPTGMEVARVTHVIDGDTIRVERNGREERVRYIGLDAPEVQSTRQAGEPGGVEATEYNRSLVGGREVYLERDVSETDRYGRLLRYVWVDGVMVNAALIRQGVADGRDYPPDVRYSKWFYELEGEARQEGLGIWSR